MTTDYYQLYEFDFNKINPHEDVLFIFGKRKSGKSRLVKEILFQLRHKIRKVIVFSSSEPANHYYESISIPASFIHSTWTPAKMDKLWKIQKERMQPTLIIFDDFAFHNEIANHESLRELYYNGRHYNCGIINVAQYVINVPLKFRSQATFVACFRENSTVAKTHYYKGFFHCFDDEKTFVKNFDKHTENQRFLIVDCSASSLNVSECVFWGNCHIDRPKFYLGCESYRKYYNVPKH